MELNVHGGHRRLYAALFIYFLKPQNVQIRSDGVLDPVSTHVTTHLVSVGPDLMKMLLNIMLKCNCSEFSDSNTF